MGQYQQNYNTELEAWRMPYNILPSAGLGAAQSGYITQSGNPWAGAASGAMMGGLASYNMFGGNQGFNQNQGFTIPPYMSYGSNYIPPGSGYSPYR
jgi:hypothetical protein